VSVKAVRKKFINKYGMTFSMSHPSAVSGLYARVTTQDKAQSDPLKRDGVCFAEFSFDTVVRSGGVLTDVNNEKYLVIAFHPVMLGDEVTHYVSEMYKCNAIASVSRKSRTVGIMGGAGTVSEEELYSDVPCFFARIGIDSGEPNVGVFPANRHSIFMSNAQEVKKGDNIDLELNSFSVLNIDSVTYKNCLFLIVEEV